LIYLCNIRRKKSPRFTWQQFRRRVEHAGDLAVRHEGPAEGDAADVGAQEEGDLLDFGVLESIKNSGAFHSLSFTFVYNKVSTIGRPIALNVLFLKIETISN
jgi:hypothetical protein